MVDSPSQSVHDHENHFIEMSFWWRAPMRCLIFCQPAEERLIRKETRRKDHAGEEKYQVSST